MALNQTVAHHNVVVHVFKASICLLLLLLVLHSHVYFGARMA